MLSGCCLAHCSSFECPDPCACSGASTIPLRSKACPTGVVQLRSAMRHDPARQARVSQPTAVACGLLARCALAASGSLWCCSLHRFEVDSPRRGVLTTPHQAGSVVCCLYRSVEARGRATSAALDCPISIVSVTCSRGSEVWWCGLDAVQPVVGSSDKSSYLRARGRLMGWGWRFMVDLHSSISLVKA